MLIEIRNLTKQFGNFVAVDDVSFDVRQGETVALLGPNGSGKTTTLKCIVGLAAPSSGRINVGGYDATRQSRDARRLLSYLPQRVSFHESLTAREVMEFYCRLRRVPTRRVDELFATEAFHFNGFSKRPVGEFSGGMLQRLGLAVACVPDAQVLILDEPAVSLDPEGAIQFREFLSTLKLQGKTILFSSHMLGDVERLADRVGILVGGKLVALEALESLREGLTQASRMRLLLGSRDERFIGITLTAGAVDAFFEGGWLVVASPPERRIAILDAIKGAGGVVERLATEEPTLEDFYLRYIREEKRENH